MTTTILKRLLFIIPVALLVFAFTIHVDLPKGWFAAGNAVNKYDMGMEVGGPDSTTVATIKSKGKRIDGFGTLMQTCLPGSFAGKRIRMSGLMRLENVSARAGFWLRVDAAGSSKPLDFDNMDNQKLKGTKGWQRYSIEVNVPNDASQLAYGALLVGSGQIWFDDIYFEAVGNLDPKKSKGTPVPNKPQNLGFEQ